MAGRAAGGAPWLGAGLAACVAGWGANQFTPMPLLYRSQRGLGAAVVEAMFGLHAAGLIPGLLVGGSPSDRIGRRRVALFALVLSVIGGSVLIMGTRHRVAVRRASGRGAGQRERGQRGRRLDQGTVTPAA